MENKQIDLTKCQDCAKEGIDTPAIYGDGVTWARCSKHQYQAVKVEEKIQPLQQAPVNEGSFEHEIVEDLTSIILPIYMVNYTLFHYTGNCIGSVREHTDETKTPYELVVIDNGSPVKPPSENSYYAHRVILNKENMGVTKAWNQGIRMSIGEYIVLLNNDVQVFEYWLEDMKKALDEGGYDLVMAHPMYSLTEPFARATESRKIRNKVIESGKFFSDFKDFSCVMFKRSLLDEVGMFDEDFFNYASDSDLFKRMEQKGKTWACVDTVATSHISDATGYSIEDTPAIMDKDKETFAKKWSGVSITPEQQTVVESNSTPTPTQVPPKVAENLFRVINGGDPIYLLHENKVHHIKNPETLKELGFGFGQERAISKEEFAKFEKGDSINMSNVEEYK